jgi:hypothetical protein
MLAREIIDSDGPRIGGPAKFAGLARILQSAESDAGRPLERNDFRSTSQFVHSTGLIVI